MREKANTEQKLTTDQKDYVKRNSNRMTQQEIADYLKIPKYVISKRLHETGIKKGFFNPDVPVFVMP